MTSNKKTFYLFLVVLLIYLGYAGIYIYRTSFLFGGERYYVLFDDAMISMRYAKNLAEGYGLVWNPGETPVEGYTNPLWVVYMALFHLLPIPTAKLGLAIQISGAIFLTANLFFVYKISKFLTDNPIVNISAVVLTAFYTPINNWGLQGMEVSVLILMTSAALWMALNNLQEERFSIWLYVLLGIGTLVRIDMAVPYLVILGVLVIFNPTHRAKNLTWGLGVLFVFLFSQTAFRWAYYGEVLPNTYYLKMSGFPLILRIKRGLYVLVKLIIQLNWVLCLIPFTILLYRRDRVTLLLFLILIGQIAYSVYVGGDAWEHKGGSNRYISIGVSSFFILFAYACESIVNTITGENKPGSKIFQAFANLGLIFFLLGSMVNFNYLLNLKSLERWALIRQPIFIEANKESVSIASALQEITTPEASIAVVGAGAIPYFSERPAIDLLGKNDPYIAQLPSQIPNALEDIRPGHMKWDYDYSIGQLKPDVVVQLWEEAQPAETYLTQYYTVVKTGDRFFTVRSDSEEILWERVEVQP
jgi:arabinofuranosyltransferase